MITHCYRITGPQSIERIDPLLNHVFSQECNWERAVQSSIQTIDFVWETSCEKSWKHRHDSAKVLNRLHNTNIIEDKSNFAFIQLRMKVCVLETFIATDLLHVLSWCEMRWKKQSRQSVFVKCEGEVLSSADWWVLKASRGNGGKDVWIINMENYLAVVQTLPKN